MLRPGKELDLRQRHRLHRRQLPHPAFPHMPPLRGRRLRHPADLAIRRDADRHAALHLLHHEEGLAEHRGVALEPQRFRHPHIAAIGQHFHHAELLLEQSVDEHGEAPRLDPHHEALGLLLAVFSPARIEQDRLMRLARTARIGQIVDAQIRCAGQLPAHPVGE